MPEGPQMVFLKEQTSHFIGQRLIKVEGSAKNIPWNTITGNQLTDLKTFGKELLFCFPDFTIRIHLMLFGKCAIDEELNRELRLGLEFETGSINFYACECQFIKDPLVNIYDWSTDILNDNFDTNKALQKLCSKPKQLICEALLDQHVFAGVGNKIKNEVLFRSQVHPESLVGEIPENVLKKLIQECIRLSVEYLNWKWEGTEDEHWKVYRQTECLRDQIPLQKEKIGKSRRSCYFCNKCQKLYVRDGV